MVMVLSKFHLKSNKFYIGISNSFRLIGVVWKNDLLIKSSSRVNNMEYYITSMRYHEHIVCAVKYLSKKKTPPCVCVWFILWASSRYYTMIIDNN